MVDTTCYTWHTWCGESLASGNGELAVGNIIEKTVKCGTRNLNPVFQMVQVNFVVKYCEDSLTARCWPS